MAGGQRPEVQARSAESEVQRRISKKMAKTAAVPAPGGNGGGGIGGKWNNISNFFRDVRNEMRKVTTPSLKEVRATTTVVIITVALFGIYFWAVDSVIGRAIDWVLRSLTHR